MSALSDSRRVGIAARGRIRETHSCFTNFSANIFARLITFESKAQADCISMKTKKDPYDAGFQVCYPAAFEDAGIHLRSGIDARISDRRQLGHFRANQWRRIKAG